MGINTIVWCMMVVSINNGTSIEQVETAVKGRIIETNRDQYGDKVYTVNFIDYMKEKGYKYNASHEHWEIPEYLCTEVELE